MTGRPLALALALSLSLAWTSAPAFGDISPWGEGHPRAVQPQRHPPEMVAFLKRNVDNPILVIDRIVGFAARVPQDLAILDPDDTFLVRVVADPGLLESHRAEIESRVGPDKMEAFRGLVSDLHTRAETDGRLGWAFDRIAGSIAYPKLPDGTSFDGGERSGRAREPVESAPPAPARDPAESVPLAPALVWPADGDPGYARRVHAITSENGRLLINGKPAASFHRHTQEGGAAKDALVHPEDPELLVHVYQSPRSLDAFERKAGKLERLAPLAAAGAAPRLIEHGEAPVAGLGKVFFYVQELVEGMKLKSFAPEARPLKEVSKLFERLREAGLALQVPGPDGAWLLSNIIVGKTASGGYGAYLLDGTVEARAPEELESHYAMLNALLIPGSSRPPAEEIEEHAETEPPSPGGTEAQTAVAPIERVPAELPAPKLEDLDSVLETILSGDSSHEAAIKAQIAFSELRTADRLEAFAGILTQERLNRVWIALHRLHSDSYGFLLRKRSSLTLSGLVLKARLPHYYQTAFVLYMTLLRMRPDLIGAPDISLLNGWGYSNVRDRFEGGVFKNLKRRAFRRELQMLHLQALGEIARLRPDLAEQIVPRLLGLKAFVPWYRGMWDIYHSLDLGDRVPLTILGLLVAFFAGGLARGLAGSAMAGFLVGGGIFAVPVLCFYVRPLSRFMAVWDNWRSRRAVYKTLKEAPLPALSEKLLYPFSKARADMSTENLKPLPGYRRAFAIIKRRLRRAPVFPSGGGALTLDPGRPIRPPLSA